MDFKLRPFKHDDAKSFFEHSNSQLIHDNMRDGFPSTLGGCASLVSSYVNLEEEIGLIRAIDIKGAAVGSIALFLQEGGYSAELSFWLGESYWGNGIITTGINEICDLGFDKYGLVRIFAEPFAANRRSRGILEKCGFKMEGLLKRAYRKSGLMLDYCIYALLDM